jgi:non-ribosomal peptide synthetase component E (peptide arylation enzyme)
MAQVIAFIPDLLFGSAVMSSLQAAGHQVELRSGLEGIAGADLLIVDLTADPEQRIAEAARLRPPGTPVLAFYSHVEADVRTQAQEAGFELVVPRSRMAREGVALTETVLSR